MTSPYCVAKKMLGRFETAVRIRAVHGKISATADPDTAKIRDEYRESREALLSYLRRSLPKERS